jgi:hypothetical protein
MDSSRKNVLNVLLGAVFVAAIWSAAFFTVAPSLHDADRQNAELAQATAERATEIDAMRRQLNQLRSATARPAGTAASATPTVPLVRSPSLVNLRPPRRGAAGASRNAGSTSTAHEGMEADVLRDLDVTDDSDYDPLAGMGDSSSGSRKR